MIQLESPDLSEYDPTAVISMWCTSGVRSRRPMLRAKRSKERGYAGAVLEPVNVQPQPDDIEPQPDDGSQPGLADEPQPGPADEPQPGPAPPAAVAVLEVEGVEEEQEEEQEEESDFDDEGFESEGGDSDLEHELEERLKRIDDTDF